MGRDTQATSPRHRRLALLLAVAASLASLARAEESPEHGRLGLLFEASGGARLGALACPTRRLCLRPSLSYEWIKNDNAATLGQIELNAPVYQTTERYVGAGLDVLWRFRARQPLCPYVGFSGALLRSNVPYPDLVGEQVVLRNGPLTRTSFGPLAGLEYSFSRHFAVYADVGLSLTNYERFDLGGRRLHTRIWGTVASGVGIALTLK